MTLAERPVLAPPTLPKVHFAGGGSCAHTPRSGCCYCRPRMFSRERFNFALKRMEIYPSLEELLDYARQHPGDTVSVRPQ